MHRRALLASLGVAAAGCLDSAPSASGTTSRSTTGQATTVSTDAEYELTDLEVSTSTDRPSFEYVLEPSKFYSAEGVENEETRTGEEQVVKDVSDIENSAVRDAIETAIDDREWRSNELPEGLAELVERVDFFTGVTDGTYTHIGLVLYRLDPDAPPAIEFDASVVDSTVEAGDPGAVELALTNASSTPRHVFSGTVPPFGMVFAEATERNARFLLWRPYEEEGCVNIQDDGGWSRCDIGMIAELEPGETVAREYEVLPSTTTNQPGLTLPPGPGPYRIADSISHSEKRGAPKSELSFEVEFTLESR